MYLFSSSLLLKLINTKYAYRNYLYVKCHIKNKMNAILQLFLKTKTKMPRINTPIYVYVYNTVLSIPQMFM